MILKSLLISSFLFAGIALGQVSVNEAELGKSLGGWKQRAGRAAEYPLSGTTYRTYRPEVTPTPDGGIFISLRIDHVRGWLSSDDHAMLEITVDEKGTIISAQSSIAIQGRSVTSDLIRSGTDAGQELAGVDRAVQVGTDLIADISAKMLREKIVEAGRVSFPAALRHNYNLLFQAIRTEPVPPKPIIVNPLNLPGAPQPKSDPKAEPAASKKSKGLEIRSYGGPEKPELTPAKKD
ncbi:hypothetical protein ACFSSA_13925 [Luteolibacter algae]|uniref:Uncharacterized protein n=2 Tax=Luteolibacter algae TaxID=454151 RepID=A0ABW5DBD8_9BACT